MGQIFSTFNLIEVKSKSANPETFKDEFWTKVSLKKGEHALKATWKPYIYDVAFQSFVLKNAFPNMQVNNFLMCADKSKETTVDGLNQKFILTETNRRTSCEIRGDVTKKALGDEILCKLDLNDVIQIIHNENYSLKTLLAILLYLERSPLKFKNFLS